MFRSILLFLLLLLPTSFIVADAPVHLDVPVTINNNQQGELSLHITNGIMTVSSSEIRNLFSTWLLPTVQNDIWTSLRNTERVPLSAFAPWKIVLTFEQSTLTLNIDIPFDLLSSAEHHFAYSGAPPPGVPLTYPKNFSAYVNVRGSDTYTMQNALSRNESFSPPRLQLDSAMASKWGVLENVSSLQNHDWEANTTRYVVDDEKRLLRYTAGDLQQITFGQQSLLPIVGLGLSRNFHINPYLVTSPLGNAKVLLRTSSTVEIYANGQWVGTQYLEAGPHEFTNLPLQYGTNNIRLKITDDTGSTEELSLPFLFEPQLLKEGLHEFSYNGGVTRNKISQFKSNDTEREAIISLMHRYGLTEKLTLGGYFQTISHQSYLGGELIWASPIGTFSTEQTASFLQHFNPQYASRFIYHDYPRSFGPWIENMHWNLSLSYWSAYFSNLGNLQPTNSNLWTLASNITIPFKKLFVWNVGAQYDRNRTEPRYDYLIYSSIGKSIGRFWDINLSAQNRKDIAGRVSWNGVLTVSFVPQKVNQRLSITQNFGDAESTLNWQYSSPRAVNSLNGSATSIRNAKENRTQGTADFTSYRGYLLMGQNHNVQQESGFTTRSTTLNFGTALVFVDGHFGITRPIGNNGFAMIIPNEQFADQRISVDPSSMGSTAQSGLLGPAIVHNIRSYQYRQLNLAPADIPLGYDFGPQQFHLMPKYRSGFAIHVGKDATVFLEGTLLDKNGSPIAFQAGNLHKEGQVPLPFFTTKKGKISVIGVASGEYELKLFSQRYPTYRFTIPKETKGIYKLGEVKLQAENSVDEEYE